MLLTQTNNMQSHRRRVVMHHTIMQNNYISSKFTHKLIENMTIKMNATKITCSKMIKIMYEQEGQH